MSATRWTRSRKRPAAAGWALIREALQTPSSELVELLWFGEHVGLVIVWD